MKKTDNKVSRLALLAAAAAFAAAPLAPLSVLAEQISDTNIVVANASQGSYKLYQLFTGDYSTTGSGTDEKTTFGNIKVNPAYKDIILTAIQAYNANFTLSGSEDNQANQLAEAVAALQDTQGFANTLAGLLQAQAPTSTQDAAANDSTVTFPVTETGYYLIASDTGNKTQTSGILVPVTTNSDVNVQLKASEPTVTKQTAYYSSHNYGEYTQAGLIGGVVQAPNYKITGTLNKTMFDYDTYYYSIKDTLPAGMTTTQDEVTADWNVKVTAYKSDTDTQGTALTPALTVDSNTITWTFDDLKTQLTGWTSADAETGYIEITYTPVYDDTDITNIYGQVSTLDAPQTNTAELTYSNNPYKPEKPEEAVYTVADIAKVYSFNLNLKKITADNKALEGAAFTLTDKAGNTIGKEITTDDQGVFVFTGLEADTPYTLTETKVPAGYKKIDPITFTLTANADGEGMGLTGITVNESEDPSNAAVWGENKDTASAVFNSTTADLYIGNTAGPNMPSTGESGIVIATAAGLGILSLSAAAILKKKKESQD